MEVEAAEADQGAATAKAVTAARALTLAVFTHILTVQCTTEAVVAIIAAVDL